MKNRSGEKIKLASIDELLGVVNEESAMEIEISKIHPFKNHPFKVLDEKRFDSDNRSEDYQAYENLVKETIDYESLEVTHHDDMRQVDEKLSLISVVTFLLLY